MAHSLSLIAAGCLCVSFIVHLLSLFGANVKMDIVIALHVGLVAFGVVTMLSMPRGRENREEVAKLFPRWSRRLWICLWFYLCLNMLWLYLAERGGTPKLRNGRPVLVTAGKETRPISREEYLDHQAQIVRMFSCGWILGYFGMWLVNSAQAKREAE